MAGYGSYQGSGSYLEAAQGNMGYGTVRPGVFTPSHNQEKYGVYLGDAASAELAAERMARDVENSRVALSNAAKFEREMADHEDYMAQRANRQEAAELEHENRRISAESLRKDFALKNSAHALAMEEQDEKARIYSEMRQQRDMMRKKPLYLMLTELYSNGSVSEEALQEYNKANPNGQLSDFRQDPNTGELYGVAADGKTLVPFEGQGVLDTWAQYHPDGQKWALSAMPPQVREQARAQFELQRKATQERLNQEKWAYEETQKSRNNMAALMRHSADFLADNLKTARERLNDGKFEDESERQLLIKQIQADDVEYRNILKQIRSLWDPNAASDVPLSDNITPEQQQAFHDLQQASRGINMGGGGVSDWKTKVPKAGK